MSDNPLAGIANFAQQRLFPAMDDYAAAHALRGSVDAGVLVLLVKRLIHQGMAPNTVSLLVEQAIKRNPAPREASPPPPPPPPPEAEKTDQTHSPNVLPFRRE